MPWRLELSRLRCQVRLGDGAAERATPQEIEVSVSLASSSPLKACETDALADTVCYAAASEVIRAACADREYRLIERLGAEIHGRLKRRLAESFELCVGVRKLAPPIEGLAGGAYFEISS